jgi:hypothetical protein
MTDQDVAYAEHHFQGVLQAARRAGLHEAAPDQTQVDWKPDVGRKLALNWKVLLLAVFERKAVQG